MKVTGTELSVRPNKIRENFQATTRLVVQPETFHV